MGSDQGHSTGTRGHVGATARDNRLFVDAVIYRYRAGIPWRDLPERFGAWKAVHTRFSRWAKSGVWRRLFEASAADADNEYAMIDSTIVRAHQHSAGAQKRRRRSSDRPKQGGLSTSPYPGRSVPRAIPGRFLLTPGWAITAERRRLF